VDCDFLPASGMLLHLPSLHQLKLPDSAYFLDLYDFALGLAIKAAGAGVWLVPALELSHQVGRKVTLIKNGNTHVFADMPVARVRLLHRNSTYLYTRSAHGFDKLLAAGWQGRRAVLQAWRFIYYGFDQRWSKAAAALAGWALGLFGLASARNPEGVK
jgi:GT2 family glycosyltransferase